MVLLDCRDTVARSDVVWRSYDREREQDKLPEVQALNYRWTDEWEAALQSLLATRATTVAGVTAPLDYVASDAFSDYDNDRPEVRDLIQSAAESLRAMVA